MGGREDCFRSLHGVGNAITPKTIVQHLADLVVHLARLPLDVSVPQLTVTAAGMPFIGRG